MNLDAAHVAGVERGPMSICAMSGGGGVVVVNVVVAAGSWAVKI
jgi:hypothetical protein